MGQAHISFFCLLQQAGYFVPGFDDIQQMPCLSQTAFVLNSPDDKRNQQAKGRHNDGEIVEIGQGKQNSGAKIRLQKTIVIK
jgi:hypothetical protein